MNTSSQALHHPLWLASRSRWRAELLQRLGLPFSAADPRCDERPRAGENAPALVKRLARDKARSLAQQHGNALIIGSDQVAELDGEVLGKPGHLERAIEQLNRLSGQRAVFYTGLCLLNAKTGREQLAVEPFTVYFRPLSERQIERYLWKEKPFDCAGSFKSEGLGIALFERFEGNDPTALIGLPLMRLVTLLDNEGVVVP